MRKVVITVATMLLGSLVVFAQSVPQLVNYQGRLTDADGAALTTANYKLEFNIYDTATGGNVVWGPQTFAEVPVANGYFNVILGPQDSASTPRDIAVAFSGAERYIGIKVNDGTELAPRQQILSAPFAIKAGHHSNIIPPGTIMPFAGLKETIPLGWLLCDGTAVSSQIYSDLYSAISTLWGKGDNDDDNSTDFNIPDLRGVFIRGVDHGAGKDPDASGRIDCDGNVKGDYVGTYQADEFKAHCHSYTHRTGSDGHPAGEYSNIAHASTTNNTNDTGGNETRPRNVAVNYIIKY